MPPLQCNEGSTLFHHSWCFLILCLCCQAFHVFSEPCPHSLNKYSVSANQISNASVSSWTKALGQGSVLSRVCAWKVKLRNLPVTGSVLWHRQTWRDKMHPYNPMCVVTHRGDMWTASCNAWEAVRALARWLIRSKAQEIVKISKDIKWKSCCSTAKSSLSSVSLCHTMWVWSCSPSMFSGTTNIPLAAAGLHCREAGDCWSWRWLCRIRAAHSDISLLFLQCRRAGKIKKHFWWNSWSSGDLLNQCYTVHAACSVSCC